MRDVALVLMGHTRTFYEHVESYQRHIIDACDCDVIMHTWNMLDGGFSQVLANKHAKVTKQHVDRLKETKNLVLLKIDEEREQDDVVDIPRALSRRKVYFKAPGKCISRCLYARKMAGEALRLHENNRGKRYEVVIIATYDICVRTSIDISLLQQGTLHVALSERLKTDKLVLGGRLTFADRDTIDHWFNMHDNLGVITKLSRDVVIMESLANDYIAHLGMKFADIGMTYDLVRLDGFRVTYDHILQKEIIRTDEKCRCQLTSEPNKVA